jgi:hypothetical protein
VLRVYQFRHAREGLMTGPVGTDFPASGRLILTQWLSHEQHLWGLFFRSTFGNVTY